MWSCVSSGGRWNLKSGEYTVKSVPQNTAGISDNAEEPRGPNSTHQTLSDFWSPRFAPVNDKLRSCNVGIPGSNVSSPVKRRRRDCQVLNRKKTISLRPGCCHRVSDRPKTLRQRKLQHRTFARISTIAQHLMMKQSRYKRSKKKKKMENMTCAKCLH